MNEIDDYYESIAKNGRYKLRDLRNGSFLNDRDELGIDNKEYYAAGGKSGIN